jgi:hypothetical protein
VECGYGATAIAARHGVARCGAVQRNATYANANYGRVRQFGIYANGWWFVNDRMKCGMNARRDFV